MKSQISEKIITITLFSLIFQAFVRILGIIQTDFMDPTNFLELVFFIITAINLNFESPKRITSCFLIVLMWGVLILLSYLGKTPLYESIRAYKWLLFLIALACIGRRNYITNQMIRKWYKTLLLAMATAYIIQIASLGFSTRPQLLLENNYECAFLIGLFALNISQRNIQLNRKYLLWNLLFLFTIISSGSRSALISLMLVLIVLYIKSTKKSLVKLFGLLALTSSLMPVLWILIKRGTNLQNVDRYYFLQLFLHDFSMKSDISKLLGSWIIQPLSTETCVKLRFYAVLQNDEILGSCFSVILHSFILRSIYDFGLIGTFLIFIAFWTILKSKLDTTLSISLIAIGLANSISVSGINNIYVVMPACLGILMKNELTFVKNESFRKT